MNKKKFSKLLKILRRTFCLLLPFLLFSAPSQAQQISEKEVEDLLNNAKGLVFSDAKRSAKLAGQVIALSKAGNYQLFEASAWNIKGIISHFTGSPDSALIYFNRSEAIGLKINDPLTIAKAKQNKNLPYGQMGRYDLALAACMEALVYYEKIGDKIAIARCYGDIGNILIRQKNAREAIGYLNKAIATADAMNQPSLKANFLNSLGVAYNELKQPRNAYNTYLQALELAEKANNIKSQISLNTNLGYISWSLDKEDDKSFQYYKKAETLAKQYGDQSKLGEIYQNLGRNYFHRKDIDQALKYGLLARDLALDTKDNYSLNAVFASLGEYYKLKNNYAAAFDNLEKRDSITKILFSIESSKQVNELKTKYETEKKQQQIALLNIENQVQGLTLTANKLEIGNKNLELEKTSLVINNQLLDIEKKRSLIREKELETRAKNQKIKLLNADNELQKFELFRRNIIIGIVAGILTLSILAGFLFYNRYKLRQENRLQESVIRQQDLATRAVLNAEENERKRISGELHDGLGQMFSAVKMNLSGIAESMNFKDAQSREVFDKTLDLVDESCREVRVISHQMAPNVLLRSGLATAVRDFIDKIDSRKLQVKLETFGLKDRLDQNIETVLYRVIQESVNNVIKHSGGNTLDIQLNKDDEGINVMIEDNGKGFDSRQMDKFDGIGLKNIRSRIEYLKGTVDFSSQPGSGTLVAIHIPL